MMALYSKRHSKYPFTSPSLHAELIVLIARIDGTLPNRCFVEQQGHTHASQWTFDPSNYEKSTGPWCGNGNHTRNIRWSWLSQKLRRNFRIACRRNFHNLLQTIEFRQRLDTPAEKCIHRYQPSKTFSELRNLPTLLKKKVFSPK